LRDELARLSWSELQIIQTRFY